MNKTNRRDILCLFLNRKTFRIMKLTCLLLIIFVFQSVASTYAQQTRINLNLDNSTVKSALKEIESKSEFTFFYNDAEFDMNRKVSIHVKDERIDNILLRLLPDSKHVVENKKIILIPGKANRNSELVNQKTTVSGIVVDETGLPLIGVNVFVEGSNNGVVTDIDGKYSIQVENGNTLSFSYVGYQKQTVVYKGNKVINVTLREDSKALDEVIVIGFGKMKKGDLSAAVSSLSNVEQLQKRPVSSAQDMLQGQIPGVTVVQDGGSPNSTPSVTIRGIGSRKGESPLYVVDGVPNAPFNLSDVVSMTVLKDAASAAIYGAYAGSAGVILVTTKQAEAGEVSVEYNVVTGAATSYNLPQSLTIDEERMVRASALGGEDKLPDGWNVDKNPYIGQTRTDWIDAIFRTGLYQRHNVAVSGGKDNFSNRISLEYSDRQGTLINTYSKSVLTRFNSIFKINKYIQIREDFTWKTSQARGATTSGTEGVILSALEMPRNAEVYNADGSYGGTAPSNSEYIQKYGSNFADIHGDVINPVRQLTAAYNNNKTSQLTTSTFLEIKEPIKGLNFTSRFTYKLTNAFTRYYDVRRLEPGKPNDRNHLTYSSSYAPGWDIENTLSYDRVFNRHNIGLMASTTANQDDSRGYQVTGRDFESEDEALMYFSQAKTFDRPTDSWSKDRNLSVVGRVSYSFADRYFVTASWRRDYAGRLPKDKKYGDFPSVTGAWKLTSEPFMPKSDILNLLKVRASWGRIGNLGSIGKGYAYQNLTNMIIQGGDCGGQIGYDNPIMIGKFMMSGFNPYLTWETSEQTDLGLDAAFFNNRLNITADYFMKKTLGLIKEQDAGWTSSIGLSPMMVNDGEIHNSGFELSVGWSDRVGKIDYWVNGNMATLRNRVYDIGAADANGDKPVWTDGGSFGSLSPYRTEEGQPLYSFFLIPTDGVFMSQSEVDSYTNEKGEKIQPAAQVGDLRFVDTNKDGVINSEDRVYMGNAMPKVTYSLSGGLSWNNFTFNIMLQGVGGVKIFNAYKSIVLNESNGNYNRSRDILKALNGPNKDVPRISSTDANGNFTTNSDYFLEKGDYLRIKNVSLGYSFTNLFQKCAYLRDRKSALDLTFSIDNLATFTSYSGIDPEVGGNGLDGGQYPVARTYSVALKMKF